MGLVVDCLDVPHKGKKIEPYSKGGFVCSFEVAPNENEWPEVIVEALSLAQHIGRDWKLSGSFLEAFWKLSGSIEDEVDAWSNDSSVHGVKSVHLVVENA